jgi:hypothetical protein
MKFLNRRNGFAGLLMAICMAVAMLAFMPLPTEAQVSATTTGTFSGIQASVTNAASISPTNSIITVRQGKGLAVLPTFWGTGASSANVTFTFNVSADGTNYTTTGPLTAVIALNGTTPVTGYTLFDPTELNNVKYLKLSTIANAGAVGCVISNVVYSVSN